MLSVGNGEGGDKMVVGRFVEGRAEEVGAGEGSWEGDTDCVGCMDGTRVGSSGRTMPPPNPNGTGFVGVLVGLGDEDGRSVGVAEGAFVVGV